MSDDTSRVAGRARPSSQGCLRVEGARHTVSGRDLGVAPRDAGTLGPLLAAAGQLGSLEPGNLALAAAVDTLRTVLLAGVTGHAAYRTWVAAHQCMWAVRHWAERVDQSKFDTDDVAFTAWLLPPVAERAALICLAGGPGIDLDDPTLARATRDRAAGLLRHHGLAVLGRPPPDRAPRDSDLTAHAGDVTPAVAGRAPGSPGRPPPGRERIR